MWKVAMAAAALCSGLAAQTFEVASVKPTPPPGSPGAPRGVAKTGGPGSTDPGRVRFTNFSLQNLVSEAYDMPFYRISGPGWTEELRFDITATMPPGTSEEQYRLMLRNLLTERFKLELHQEEKTLPRYSLVVARGASRLSAPKPLDAKVKPTVTTPGAPMLPAGHSSMGIASNNGHPQARLQAYNEPVSWLTRILSGQLHSIVTDETGLTGTYDFVMSWAPEQPGQVSSETSDSGPGLFTALQEQLGLKLVAGKGPALVIVIDRANQSPGEN